MHELSNEEVRAAGEQLLEFLHGGDSIYGFQPWEHMLAEEYLRRGAYLDRVAALAGSRLEVVLKRSKEQGWGQMPAAMRLRMNAPLRAAEIGTVDLLARVGKREDTDGLAVRLAGLTADGPYEIAMRWQAESRLAELAGRPLDALVYTEKAIGKWELKDMVGKKWVSGELAGKTVFVNVRATWCGPCRAEHPYFQKLYEQLKDRKDVAVISFNVDDQVGLVQSYLTEGKYTFPVLLADRLVRDALEAVSIPRNWLVDGKGVHQLEQIGFPESSDWMDRMLAGLEKLK